MNRFASAALFVSLLSSSALACSSSDTTGSPTGSGSDAGAGGAGATSDGSAGSGASNDAATGTGTTSGDDSGSGSVAPGSGSLSCNDPDDHLCTTYAMGDAADCGGSVGVVVAACATTNVVATCKYNAGGTDQEIFWYTGVSANMATLMSTCSSLNGTYTAGN